MEQWESCSLNLMGCEIFAVFYIKMSKDKAERIKAKPTMNLCVSLCVYKSPVCLIPLCSGTPLMSKNIQIAIMP